jgi:SPP1 gp7 family putative phage head morphogenesis protein
MPDQLDDILSRSFQRVRSVPAEAADALRERLREGLVTGASTADVLRAALRLDEEEAAAAARSPEELRRALRQIWEKTRTDYQRILRTETINAYSKLQLQEWYDQGIRRVTRHSIDDMRTCAKCRQLSAPGHNIFMIEDLLRLDHPVTENPDAPGTFLTHPNCRCTFAPLVEDLRDQLEEMEREFFADLESEDTVEPTRIEGIPLDSQESMERLLPEMSEGGAYRFIKDVRSHPDWAETQDTEGTDVLSWVAPDGITYISDQARFSTYVTFPVALREGELVWERLGKNEKGGVEKRWKEKHAQTLMTLSVEGVELVGGAPFFNAPAADSPEGYFSQA